MSRWVKVAFAFVSSLFGCVEARSQGHLGHRLLTIPVEIDNIAGTFIVDTGADTTVIDSAFAQRLGLKPWGAVLVERNYSTERSIAVAAHDVRIGPKRWSGVQLVIQDLSMLSRIQGTSISGVLGTDLLATMIVRLSYSSGMAQVTTEIGDGASVVVLKRVQNRFLVPVRIGPSNFEMLLDSGTDMTALSASAWRMLASSWKPNGLVEGHLGLLSHVYPRFSSVTRAWVKSSCGTILYG